MKGSTFSVIAGVLALLGGIFALIFPLPAGLTVAVFVAWAFVISGAFGLWAAFADKDMTGRLWVALMALIELVLGVWLLANPLASLISLTLLVGILLAVSGAARLWMARDLRGNRAFWLVVISGIASLALGLYTIFALSAATPILLGTLLAIELISVGAMLLAAGIFLKRHTGL